MGPSYVFLLFFFGGGGVDCLHVLALALCPIGQLKASLPQKQAAVCGGVARVGGG